MINKLQSKTATFMLALSLLMLTVSSCTKKSEDKNDAAKFIGTWTGTSTCSSSGTPTVTFSAGSDGTKFTFPGTAGNGSCEKAITLQGTASGNSMTLPATTVTDNCGNSYTMTGAGTLNGNTLTFTMAFTGAVTATCVFTGTK